MAISIDNLRIGLRYYLKNFDERTEFEVLEKISENDFKVKDLHSLETFYFQDLIRFGISKDYELEELGAGE